MSSAQVLLVPLSPIRLPACFGPGSRALADTKVGETLPLAATWGSSAGHTPYESREPASPRSLRALRSRSDLVTRLMHRYGPRSTDATSPVRLDEDPRFVRRYVRSWLGRTRCIKARSRGVETGPYFVQSMNLVRCAPGTCPGSRASASVYVMDSGWYAP